MCGEAQRTTPSARLRSASDKPATPVRALSTVMRNAKTKECSFCRWKEYPKYQEKLQATVTFGLEDVTYEDYDESDDNRPYVSLLDSFRAVCWTYSGPNYSGCS